MPDLNIPDSDPGIPGDRELCYRLARQLARVADDDSYRDLSQADLIDVSTGREAGPVRDRHQEPETLRQARTWERRKKVYLGAGLCGKCASRAAWGHQVGFSSALSPDSCCAPIVAAFPVPAANGWRKHPDAIASTGFRKAA